MGDRERLLLATLVELGLWPGDVTGPIDDSDNLTRKGVDIGFVPIVLHFNLELPDESGKTRVGLGVDESSWYGVDDAGGSETWTGDVLGRGFGRGRLGRKGVLGVRREGISVDGLSGWVEGGENVCESINRSQHRARLDGWSTECLVMVSEMPQSGVDNGVVGGETESSFGGRLDK